MDAERKPDAAQWPTAEAMPPVASSPGKSHRRLFWICLVAAVALVTARLGITVWRGVQRKQSLSLLIAKEKWASSINIKKIKPRWPEWVSRSLGVKWESVARRAFGRVLSLELGEISDEDVSHLIHFPELERLSIANSDMTEEGFVRLVNGCPELKSLQVVNGHVTDAEIRHFASLRQLEQLSLSGHGFTDRGLESLRSLTHLQLLDLDGSPQITDSAIAVFARVHSLRVLFLYQISMNPHACRMLAEGCPSLENLIASDAGIGDAGVRELAALSHLEVLELEVNRDISDQSIDVFNEMPALRFLGIRSTGITVEGLRRLDKKIALNIDDPRDVNSVP